MSSIPDRVHTHPVRVLGRRILDIVAPEIGEQHEAEQLATEERQVRHRTSLVTSHWARATGIPVHRKRGQAFCSLLEALVPRGSRPTAETPPWAEPHGCSDPHSARR